MTERKKTGFALGGAAAAARKANTPWRRHPHVRNAEKATLAALKCMFVDPGKTYAPVGVKDAIRAALERMEQ